MEYVYRYLNGNKKPVYVGITNNLLRRIREHEQDKLAGIKDPTIEYIPVENRGDAEILETYLINHYGTAKGYNVSKTAKGKVSFLDVAENIPWIVFNGYINPLVSPFHISQLVSKPKEVVTEKVIEKVVEVKKQIPVAKMTQDQMVELIWKQWDENRTFLKEERDKEKQIINGLTAYQREAEESGSELEYIAFVKTGIELHVERLHCVQECLKRLFDGRTDPLFMESLTRAGEILKEEKELARKYYAEKAKRKEGKTA